MENKHNNANNHSEKQYSNENIAQTMKSIQYLLISAVLLSVMSLFLPGGLFLSIGGFVCAGIGLYRVIKIRSKDPALKITFDRINTISIVCTVICGVIFILNAVSVFIIYPMITTMIESGALEEAGINTEYLEELLHVSSGKSSKW